MKCPKCGFENPEDSQYCEECGTKLEVEKFLCPACSAVVKKGAKHCGQCGKELTWVDADYDSIPVPMKSKKVETAVAKPTTKENKTTTTSSFNKKKIIPIISLVLVALGVLFTFIGWFGDAISVKGIGGSNIGLTYFFKDCYQECNELRNLPYHEAFGMHLAVCMLNTTTYVVMLLGILIFGSYTIYTHAKTLNGAKMSYPRVGSIGLMATTLIHICFTSFLYSGSNTTVLKMEFGWGFGLAIAGLVLILLSLLLERFNPEFDGFNTNRFVSTIVSSTMAILSFVVLLLIVTPINSVRNGSASVEFTPYSIMLNAMMNYSNGGTMGKEFGPALASFLFFWIAFNVGLISLLLNNKENKLGTIITSGVTLLHVITGLVYGCISINKMGLGSSVKAGCSASFVWAVILTVMLVACGIVSMVFKNKARAVAKQNQDILL